MITRVLRLLHTWFRRIGTLVRFRGQRDSRHLEPMQEVGAGDPRILLLDAARWMASLDVAQMHLGDAVEVPLSYRSEGVRDDEDVRQAFNGARATLKQGGAVRMLVRARVGVLCEVAADVSSGGIRLTKCREIPAQEATSKAYLAESVFSA